MTEPVSAGQLLDLISRQIETERKTCFDREENACVCACVCVLDIRGSADHFQRVTYVSDEYNIFQFRLSPI